MKQKLLFLLTALMLLSTGNAWGEVGDVTTNANISFTSAETSNDIVLENTVFNGTVNSITIGQGQFRASQAGWLSLDDATSTITIPEAQRAGAKDVVNVKFKRAWGNKNGMGSGFSLKNEEGEVICNFTFARWGGGANTLNIDMAGLYGAASSNAPIKERYTLFDITIDYSLRKITSTVECVNTDGKGTHASQTFYATLTNTDPIATFNVWGYNVGGNKDRADIINDIIITTTEGDYSGDDADYTINYKDGESVVKTSSGTLPVGTIVEIESSFWISTTKYVKNDGEPASITIPEGGITQNIAVSEAPKYSYTVNAKASESTLKQITSGIVYAGENAPTFYYPQFLKDGNVLYATSSQQGGTGWFKYENYIPTADNDVLNINYTSNRNFVLYFSEGEDIEGATVGSGSNAGIRCSMGAGGYFANETSLVELPAGRYRIYAQIWGNSGTNFVFKAGEADILTAPTLGYIHTPSAEFTLDAPTAISVAAAGDNGKVVDCVYIIDEAAREVAEAIADCKQHETSAAFAEAIDAQSFSTGAEVYAFHTAWQIENASSNEITKVIFDAQVSDFSRWNNARNNSGQQYTGAPDNKYFDAWNNDASDGKQKIYGLPAGTYTLKAATRASDDVADVDKYKVWVKGGSADVSVLGHHDGNTGGELGNGWSWTTLSFTLDATADVEIGFYSCPPTERWTGCDDFHLYAEGVPASLGTNGYATFASPYALNLANLPEGLTAYKASVSENTVTFTQVTDAVQANTGLLLKGAASTTYSIPVAASGSDISATNAFLVNTTGSTFSAAAGYTYYGLMKNTLTFATFDPGTVAIPSNKAYLKVANNPSARLVVRFDEEDPTAINAVEAAAPEANALKDGKYLIDNKIVLVKNGVKYSANGQILK